MQSIALKISELIGDKRDFEVHKSDIDLRMRIFDLWLMYEHNDIWEAIEEERQRRKEEEEVYYDLSTLSADSMEELIKKMGRSGDMEGAAFE